MSSLTLTQYWFFDLEGVPPPNLPRSFQRKWIFGFEGDLALIEELASPLKSFPAFPLTRLTINIPVNHDARVNNLRLRFAPLHQNHLHAYSIVAVAPKEMI